MESCVIIFFSLVSLSQSHYSPDWDSLDTRPIPLWYDHAKFGIFHHWGVYSAIGQGAWFWKSWHDGGQQKLMDNFYPKDWTYADFALALRRDHHQSASSNYIQEVVHRPNLFFSLLKGRLLLEKMPYTFGRNDRENGVTSHLRFVCHRIGGCASECLVARLTCDARF